ncbi:MAG: subunit of tubulin prefoldin [Stictis urceolatum]|nr:subunit of tubulin prefoldin [Stictis urceolata]
MSSPHAQAVDLSSLSTQQLSSIKKQLDEELEHITTSFTRLRVAQAKFRECHETVNTKVSHNTAGRPVLVPLTASLYVPGELFDPARIMVDIGTGYYIDKETKDASNFYQVRVDELGQNVRELEAILQSKTNNLRAVEDGKKN